MDDGAEPDAKKEPTMTTHEAAEKIAAALNASGEYTAKVQIKGSFCRVHVADARDSFGYIEIGARRPFASITKHGGWISLIAERAVRLTGSRAEDLEVVNSPEAAAPVSPAYPRDENEAQHREDGESWIDQYGRSNRAGT